MLQKHNILPLLLGIFCFLFSFNTYADQTVSGSVSVPAGLGITNLSVRINVVSSDSGGAFLGTTSQTILVSSGTSTSYMITNAPTAVGGTYRVDYTCGLCPAEGLVRLGFYGSSGPIFSGSDSEFLDAGTDHMGIDFDIPEGQQISGTLHLPNSETATEPLEFFVRGTSYDSSGNSAGTFSGQANFGIGDGSAPFTIDPIPTYPGGHYRISISCFSSCGDYLPFVVIGDSGPVYNFADAEQYNFGVPVTGLQLEAVRGLEVSGTLKLPGTTTFGQDLTYRMITITRDENSSTVLEQSSLVTIPANMNSAPFSVGAVPYTNGHIILRFSCQTNPDCDVYSPNGFYNDSGTVFVISSATQIDSETGETGLIVELLAGNQIMGEVQTPGLQNVTSDIELAVVVTTYDSGNNTSGFSQEVVTITSGSNSAPFTIDGLPTLSGGYYVISFNCFDCPGFSSGGFYNSSGTVSEFNQAEQLSAEPNTNTSGRILTLVGGINVSGRIDLPENYTAPSDLTLRVQLLVYDMNDVPISGRSDDVTIANGATFADYDLPGFALEPGGYFVVQIECPDQGATDCIQPFSGFGFYSDNGTVEIFADATTFATDNTAVITGIDFVLLPPDALCFPILGIGSQISVICI
ncbi:MAG: hypothetical protein AAF353_00010 [Pseudomonadota bacterium]